VHRLLPAYYLFAGRPQRGDDSSAAAQIQVVTLVHVYMAARASLLNIQTQYEDVADRAPGALRQVHFIKMSDPSSDTTLLIGNIYQAQAAEPGRQESILELARRVIIRWADQADLVVVGGDWNASTRPRVGYVGSQVTRGADARLQEWYLREDLTCAAPEHATWQSVNESRHAILDCFFWRSKSDGPSIRGAEAFLSADPNWTMT